MSVVESIGIPQSVNGLRREKTCLPGFANNTGADQPAHPRSLISAFVIRLLESIISKRNFGLLASLCSCADGLNLTLSETVKTGFLAMRPKYSTIFWIYQHKNITLKT